MYVISHKTKINKDIPMLEVVDSCGLYLKQLERDVDGQIKNIMGWVDKESADKFKTYEHAKMLVDELPFNHIIEEYNLFIKE